MAGRYYTATPIGAGLGNIADAIAGVPARREQAALLAQRRDLVESQILTDAERRGKYVEETAGLAQKRLGRAGMAEVIMGSGTSGGGGPDADPQPSPEPVGAPPSITTAFMADRLPGDPISVAPAAVAAPTAPVVPAAPNVAAAVVPQGPRTDWTPEMNRHFYSKAILADEDKAGDYARAFMGGSMAATEPNQDKALSYGQAGAGQSWKTTPTGEGAQLQETTRKNTLASQDKRYQTEQSTAAQRYGADVRAGATVEAAGVRANAPGKAGAKGKARELTPAQQSKLGDEVRVEAQKKLGRPLTEQETRDVVSAISDEFTAGSGYTDAKAAVLDGLVTGEPGKEADWYNPGSWGSGKPDTRKLNVPERKPVAAAPAAAPGAAPVPAVSGKAVTPRDNDARAVLESELSKAQARSAEIDTELKNTTYAPRIQQLKDEQRRLPGDIAGIQRELGRVPGGKRAPAAAPAAAAPAPAAAKASTSVDEWKAKAKAKGWSDKQIADALKSKGF